MQTNPAVLERRSWTPSQAFSYCEWLTKHHYENFPVGSFFIPREKRPYVWSVYAFARIADDYADELIYKGKRLVNLQEWQKKLALCSKGQAKHPVFIALGQTIRKFSLPVSLLRDLLTAFEMDVKKKRYKTFREVLHYCCYSANPVGRLVLLLFGIKNSKLFKYSDSICTGLQLANFWQDVGVDLEKDRIYLPQEDLIKFGYSEKDLFKRVGDQRFIRLMQFQVDRTRKIFLAGRPLLKFLKGRLKFEIKLTWLGGNKILDKVQRHPASVFSHRSIIGLSDKMDILCKALSQKD